MSDIQGSIRVAMRQPQTKMVFMTCMKAKISVNENAEKKEKKLVYVSFSSV